VSFAAITLCVASQRVFIVAVVYFGIDSVRKLLDTPSYRQTDRRAHLYAFPSCKERIATTNLYKTTLFYKMSEL
jgi:hypothetical protein